MTVAPPPPPPPPPPVPVPREVRIASALLLALGAMLVFNAVLALLYRGDIVDSADEQMDVYLSPEALGTVVLVAAAVLLVLGGLLILAGLQVRRGRQWGRVLAFTVAGIVVLFATIGALAGGGFLAVLMLGASVGVVAFLMQSAVAPYFASDRDRSYLPHG